MHATAAATSLSDEIVPVHVRAVIERSAMRRRT
jgi:hypothetical protein